MKQKISIILALFIFFASVIFLFLQNKDDESVAFYYCRKQYDYTGTEPVITAEKRDIAPHQEDTEYLVRLYLVGPLDKNLELPFPSQTRLLSYEIADGEMNITLSDTGLLSDAVYSVACTCLSKTCMELTPVTSVTVTSGKRTLTTTADGLLLFDETTLQPETTIGDNET